jgi:hypothetical protein
MPRINDDSGSKARTGPERRAPSLYDDAFSEDLSAYFDAMEAYAWEILGDYGLKPEPLTDLWECLGELEHLGEDTVPKDVDVACRVLEEISSARKYIAWMAVESRFSAKRMAWVARSLQAIFELSHALERDDGYPDALGARKGDEQAASAQRADPEKMERNRKIRELRDQGLTYKEIIKELDLDIREKQIGNILKAEQH